MTDRESLRVTARAPGPHIYENPMWDDLQALAARRLVTIRRAEKLLTVPAGSTVTVNSLFAKYSRVISSPGLVRWMLGATGERVLEVDSGMAYWSYLLEQNGKFVIPHDVQPHPSAYTYVSHLDKRRSVLRDVNLADTTLLSVGAVDPRTVATALGAFRGSRAVIVMRDEAQTGGTVLHRLRRTQKSAAEARAKLATALSTGNWTRESIASGVCLEGALYTARSYRREASWDGSWDTPTQLIRIVRPEAPGLVEHAA